MAYTFLPFNQGTPVKDGILKRNMKDIEKLGPGRQGRPFKEFCTRVGERYGLTPREQEVLFLLACGYNSETIADILIVSASTARTHIYRIYQE
ncbi:MAG: helix-turn-helix transcriptional regulator [Coriobacteriales bacterium]|jgi:DNA-binding CsgD family transcriptional regulator|nr:helix-turn-helix transcriptional regulator [Coriobacteriales bacterium]